MSNNPNARFDARMSRARQILDRVWSSGETIASSEVDFLYAEIPGDDTLFHKALTLSGVGTEREESIMALPLAGRSFAVRALIADAEVQEARAAK